MSKTDTVQQKSTKSAAKSVDDAKLQTPEEIEAAKRAAQSKSDSEASQRLMAAVNTYSDNLGSAAKLTSAEKIASAIASGTVGEIFAKAAEFTSAASAARDEILKVARTNPGASTTLFSGNDPLFNPAVHNPDNPRGANSWSPRDLVLLLNRQSLKSMTRLRSSRKD